MDDTLQYEAFLRDRITELRAKKGISEHRLSLELGKSGSYIRSITSGASLPSMKEFFNILLYFEISPTEFFYGLDSKNTLCDSVCEKIRAFGDSDLQKISLFLDWIQK